MSTPDQALAPIKARLEAATPGPFIVTRYEHGGGRMFVEAEGSRRELIADTFKIGDREFYAEAPTDITRLLAAVEVVTALHTEDMFRGHMSNGCKVCGGGVGWPCPTVAALSEALGGGK